MRHVDMSISHELSRVELGLGFFSDVLHTTVCCVNVCLLGVLLTCNPCRRDLYASSVHSQRPPLTPHLYSSLAELKVCFDHGDAPRY